MNVLTAAAILLEQSNQLMNIVNQIVTISNQINSIASQENSNSIPDVNGRIKALCGSMNVQMTSSTSQTVLVQQALDQLSQLVN